MSIGAALQAVVEFVRGHQAWAAPVVFALAFGESLAFVSLLVPATGAIVGIGALWGASGLSLWPVWLAGALGAFLGDWFSYSCGCRFEDRIVGSWPLSRRPELVTRGRHFMRRWGTAGVFLGRFFGPLRAVVPLVAGSLAMPYGRFQAANLASAAIWAWVLLKLGSLGFSALVWLI